MNEKLILVERVPTLEEYQKLRKAVGWWDVDTKATEIGLHNSLFSVCVIFENEVVGCGRVIGDSGKMIAQGCSGNGRKNEGMYNVIIFCTITNKYG